MATDGIDSLPCCPAPDLEVVKDMCRSANGIEWLVRCHCGTYWFLRCSDRLTCRDDWTIWFTRLSDLEVREILDATGRPDLRFLKDKPSIRIGSSGTRQVQGQPSAPWY